MESQTYNKQIIHDLPAKLNALCMAATKTRNLKALASGKEQRGGVTARTLENWHSGKITPHNSKLSKFSEAIGVEFHWWSLDLAEFCEKIGDKYDYSAEELYSSSQHHLHDVENSILGLIGRTHGSEWMEQVFNDVFSGYWFMYHYWEQFSEYKETEDEKYIFKHLIHFYKYNNKINTILFNLASARQKKVSWNYLGHIVISQNKLYFIMQTTIRAEVEVLLLIASRPSQQNDIIKGILLASTPTRESDGIISRPAASRVVLKKISSEKDDKNQLAYFDQVGIVSETAFKQTNEIDINLLKNTIDNEIGILFPKYSAI